MSKKISATVHGFYMKNGKPVFRYLVNCDNASKELYKEALGTNYREYLNENDDKDPLNGTPLFFTGNPEGKSIELEITPAGKVVVARDVVAVMEQQIGFNSLVQAELAKTVAQQQAIRMKLVGQQA